MAYTDAYLQVAVELVSGGDGRQWSSDLRARLRLRSGALYPVLWQMLEEGYLEDGWTHEEPEAPKGRPRRYYQLTAAGREDLAAAARAASRWGSRTGAFKPLAAQ